MVRGGEGGRRRAGFGVGVGGRSAWVFEARRRERTWGQIPVEHLAQGLLCRVSRDIDWDLISTPTSEMKPSRK